MLVVLTKIYCNKANIQITQRDDLIQIKHSIPTSMHHTPVNKSTANINE